MFFIGVELETISAPRRIEVSDWRVVKVAYVEQSNTIFARLEVILRSNLCLEKGPLNLAARFYQLDCDQMSLEEIILDCEHEFDLDLSKLPLHIESSVRDLLDALGEPKRQAKVA